MGRKMIAFGGKARSGKDYVIDIALSMLGEQWQAVSTSPVVIEEYCKKHGYKPTEIAKAKDKHRVNLQKIGDDLGGVEVIKRTLDKADPEKSVLFQSVRRAKEFNYLKDKVDAFILVTAISKVRKQRANGGLQGDDHATEIEGFNCLLDYKGTYYLDNSKHGDKHIRGRLKEIFNDLNIMSIDLKE